MRTAFVEIPTFLFEFTAFSVEDAMKNQLYRSSRSNSNINSISVAYSARGTLCSSNPLCSFHQDAMQLFSDCSSSVRLRS